MMVCHGDCHRILYGIHISKCWWHTGDTYCSICECVLPKSKLYNNNRCPCCKAKVRCVTRRGKRRRVAVPIIQGGMGSQGKGGITV